LEVGVCDVGDLACHLGSSLADPVAIQNIATPPTRRAA
jgi:hypothetical protein